MKDDVTASDRVSFASFDVERAHWALESADPCPTVEWIDGVLAMLNLAIVQLEAARELARSQGESVVTEPAPPPA